MASYMITSMLCGSEIYKREELYDISSYEDAWKMHGHKFIIKILQFNFYDKFSDTGSIIFESVCKNRKGLFGDSVHNELACNYNDDMIQFIGFSIGDKRLYIPHTIYSKINNVPFDEPIWWEITDGSQIMNMMNDIELLINGKITKEKYLYNWVPMNKNKHNIVDYEGWIVLKKATYPIESDHRLADLPLMIYSKIKTLSYYKCHKFHEKNIPYMFSIAKTAGDVFHIAKKIYDIGNEQTTIMRVKKMMDLIIPHIDPLSETWKDTLVAMENKYLDELKNACILKTKDPKNPITGFASRPYPIQCRQIICSNVGKMRLEIVRSICWAYPEILNNISCDISTGISDDIVAMIADKYDDMWGPIAKFVVDMNPWDKINMNKNIANKNIDNIAIRRIVYACFPS
jgi:hypothetical protein